MLVGVLWRVKISLIDIYLIAVDQFYKIANMGLEIGSDWNWTIKLAKDSLNEKSLLNMRITRAFALG